MLMPTVTLANRDLPNGAAVRKEVRIACACGESGPPLTDKEIKA